MNILRMLPIFFIGMAVTALLLSYNIPSWLVFLIVITFYLVAMALPNIYIVYYSNSLRGIERYIKRNRHKAIFSFPFALGHGNDEDVENAINRILESHKQPEMQAAYRTLLAIHRGLPHIAVQHAETIERDPMRSYYLAYAAAAAGDFQRAEALNEHISEPWMNYSIKAMIAHEKNDSSFRSLADKSVEAARGVQKYTLLKSFSRMTGTGPA
ncbi:hypothetical protein [Planococcus sp. CAU13]|uniref:hypothetical protein n=1 Tax=Planococcus sp. CAU13 TaxID=1541197 RepID=UPI00052FF0BD|nr:hypothetical protein [Planococcus sp. CAU13]